MIYVFIVGYDSKESKFHSEEKYEQIEFWECMLQFSSESFVFTSAI
jgi:hypothetical protein